jgi:predicted XRE-type DNA-binding protein
MLKNKENMISSSTMLTTSITHNPDLKKLHQSVVDEALGVTQWNVALTLERANVLDIDPVDYEKLIDMFLQQSQVEQDRIIWDIILWYTSAQSSREALEKMKQFPTSANSSQSPTTPVTI